MIILHCMTVFRRLQNFHSKVILCMPLHSTTPGMGKGDYKVDPLCREAGSAILKIPLVACFL